MIPSRSNDSLPALSAEVGSQERSLVNGNALACCVALSAPVLALCAESGCNHPCPRPTQYLPSTQQVRKGFRIPWILWLPFL